MISKGGFFIKTNKILIALIVLLVGCMVVGAASAANTDDIAVSDLNANPDDSYMQVNAWGDYYTIDINVPDVNEGDNVTAKINVTLKNRYNSHSEPAKGYVTTTVDSGRESSKVSLVNGQYIANLGQLSPGSHSVTVKYYTSVYAFRAEEDERETFNVILIPKDANLTVSGVKDINVTDQFKVTANVNVRGAHDAGHVEFWLDGVLVKTDRSRNWDYTIPNNLTEGSHNITVKYINDSRAFLPSEVSKEFYVYKHNLTIEKISATLINDTHVIGGNDVTVNVLLNDSFWHRVSDVVYFSIDNGANWVNATAHAGPMAQFSSATYTFPNLVAGDYTVLIKYAGDAYYYGTTGNVSFTIYQAVPEFDVNVTPVESTHVIGGNDVTIVANLPSDITGNASLTVWKVLDNIIIVSNDASNQEVIYTGSAEIINGVATFNLEGLAAGNYNYQLSYPGDINYTANTTEGNFVINQAVPEINVTATPEESTYITLDGNTVTITATLPVDATGNAKIVVWREGDEGAHEYEVPIENGVATLVLDNLVAGNYNYQVYYAGDVNYTENDNNGSFVINKADPELILEVFGEHPNVKKDGSNQDFGVYVKDNIFFFANLPADATGYVYFSLDGIVWYKAPVVDGKAQYEFGELPAGEYTLYAYYTGDDNYNPTESNTTFTVESPSPYVHEEPVVPTMANTGNPLLVLFIALAGLGIGSLRRKL